MLPIVFMSNEQGAPVLNNAAGSLISVLDACLVNGFNTVGIFSITITDNVATVVTNATHGLAVGHKVTISGVSIAAATGDKTVASVVDSTTFTFPCVNADSTESPVSATVKRTPLGWLKQFNKTNVGMYKPSVPQAYGQSLRVDDTTAASAAGALVFGVENPTSIDAWADKFPLETQVTGGLRWAKGTNTTAAKAWCIVGDERFFYMLVENSSYSTYYPTGQDYTFILQFFGDIVSYKPGEAFGAIVGGLNGLATSNSQGHYLMTHSALGSGPSNTNNLYIARQQSAVAKSIRMTSCFPGGRDSGSINHPRYPAAVDNGLLIMEPVILCEDMSYANNPYRGLAPGLAAFLCNKTDLPGNNPMPQKLITTDGSNREYLFVPSVVSTTINTYTATFAVKLNESWR